MYQSKYYTCEEIDERLLKGYYDDAVSKGYTGTFEQLKLELASVDIIDLNLLNSNAGYTLTEAVAKIDELSSVHHSIARFRYTDKTYNKLRTLTYDSTKSSILTKVTDISTYTLTLTEFNGDMMKTLLTDFGKIGFEGSMYITHSGHICGKVYIFGDSMGHVVNQEVLTNCILSSDRTSLESSHNHTKIFKYDRFFNLSRYDIQDREGNLVLGRDNSLWYISTYDMVPDAYVVCYTPAGTADKTISVDGYYTIPANGGGSIKVKFTYANTVENPTLNISGTGAKPLYLGKDPVSPTNTWADGSIVEVFYDGENYRILSDPFENIQIMNNMQGQLTAILAGAKVSVGLNPAVIHVGVRTKILASANITGVVAESLELYEGSVTPDNLIASGTNKTSVSTSKMYIANSDVYFVAVAKFSGATMRASGSLLVRHPIYCGFAVAPTDIINNEHKLSPRTSATGKYSATAQANGVKYFILVPTGVSVPTNFTMGGAPYVMTKGQFPVGGVIYTMFISGSTYNKGSIVDIIAS